MDREKATDRLKAIKAVYALTPTANEALDLAIEVLGDAESATTTDCISRSDTINAMCRECKMTKSWGWCEKDCTEVAIVKGMPSMSEEEVDYCNNCPYISWGEDCISRQQAAEAFCDDCRGLKPGQCEHWDKCKSQKVLRSLPPVTPTVKVQQEDTLIIAAALWYFAQDSERNIPDRERAEELREQVLAYGAFMCKPVTPTGRTGKMSEIKTGNGKGMFMPEVTVEMFRNAPLEVVEEWLAEGEVYDIDLKEELHREKEQAYYKGYEDGRKILTEKTGEWIHCTKEGLALTELMRREGKKWYGYRCTNCNFIYKGNALTESRYCQGCGANMKGDTE